MSLPASTCKINLVCLWNKQNSHRGKNLIRMMRIFLLRKTGIKSTGLSKKLLTFVGARSCMSGRNKSVVLAKYVTARSMKSGWRNMQIKPYIRSRYNVAAQVDTAFNSHAFLFTIEISTAISWVQQQIWDKIWSTTCNVGKENPFDEILFCWILLICLIPQTAEIINPNF